VRKIVKALFDPKKFLAKVDETGIRQSLNVRPACGCVLIMKLRTRFFQKKDRPPAKRRGSEMRNHVLVRHVMSVIT